MNKLLPFILTIFLWTGCTDPCQDVLCLNGGTCLEGTCLCPDFYEGADCGAEERTKYFATYNGTTTYSDAQGNTNNYSDSKTLTISNKGLTYFNIDGGVFAMLTSPKSGVFDIPSQASANPIDSTSYFSGSGNISGNQIDYTIVVENNGETLTMSFIGTK